MIWATHTLFKVLKVDHRLILSLFRVISLSSEAVLMHNADSSLCLSLHAYHRMSFFALVSAAVQALPCGNALWAKTLPTVKPAAKSLNKMLWTPHYKALER